MIPLNGPNAQISHQPYPLLMGLGGDPLAAYAAGGLPPNMVADFENEKYLGTISAQDDLEIGASRILLYAEDVPAVTSYLSDDLLTNGGFDTDAAGWTVPASLDASVTDGTLTLTRIGATTSTMDQSAAVDDGAYYEGKWLGGTLTSFPRVYLDAQLIDGAGEKRWIQKASGTSMDVKVRPRGTADADDCTMDYIQLRKIQKNSVSLAVKRRITYADSGSAAQVRLVQWYADANNWVFVYLDTDGAKTGTIRLELRSGGTTVNASAPAEIEPGTDVECNIGFIVTDTEMTVAVNGAVAARVSTPANGLPDLTGIDFEMVDDTGTTDVDLIRVWNEDIGDEALSAATTPSLLARLATGLVDFAGISDSNQLLESYGWDHGFQYALVAAGYPMYATGIIAANEGSDGLPGRGVGYGYGFNASAGLLGARSGAPLALDAYLDKGAGGFGPLSYGYVSTDTASGGWGLSIESFPFDLTAAWRYDLHYGTFDTGSGSIQARVRLGQSPYTNLVTASAQSTNAGSFGMAVHSVTIPAETVPADAPVNCRLDGSTVLQPAFILYQRAVRTDLTAGFSYHTFDAQGGQGLGYMATDLIELSDTALSYYFSVIRDGQGAQKTIAMCVNSGLNDRNKDGETSVGPAAVDSATPAGYVDNFTALRTRIEEIWALNGWPMAELFWILFPSHPTEAPDNAEIVAYRAALKTYALTMPRTYFIDLSDLTSYGVMVANDYYLDDGGSPDVSHLSQAGYEALGSLIIGALG